MKLGMYAEAIECFKKIAGRISEDALNINMTKCIQGLKNELSSLDLEEEWIYIRKREIQSILSNAEAA